MKQRKSEQPAPFVADVIDPTKYPRKFRPEQLPVGQSVWYRDQRYYVESAPRSWDQSTFIRIGSVRFDPERPERLTDTRETFCVNADLLDLAPVTRNRFGKQPTKAAVERREMQKKTGQRDNGDEVAVLLRKCKSLDDVFVLVAKYLGETEKQLRAKYDHLDNGRKRMTLSNRLRGALKHGLIKLT